MRIAGWRGREGGREGGESREICIAVFSNLVYGNVVVSQEDSVAPILSSYLDKRHCTFK